MLLTSLLPLMTSRAVELDVLWPSREGVRGKGVDRVVYHLPDHLTPDDITMFAHVLHRRRRELGVSGIVCTLGYRKRACYFCLDEMKLSYVQSMDTPPSPRHHSPPVQSHTLYVPSDVVYLEERVYPMWWDRKLVVNERSELEVVHGVIPIKTPFFRYTKVRPSRLPKWWGEFELTALFAA